jgi:hypothetical protein
MAWNAWGSGLSRQGVGGTQRGWMPALLGFPAAAAPPSGEPPSSCETRLWEITQD